MRRPPARAAFVFMENRALILVSTKAFDREGRKERAAKDAKKLNTRAIEVRVLRRAGERC
jgi:hypothetical protein